MMLVRRHRTTASARGAVLVFALFFIVLATSLAALVAAGGVQLTRTTRHEHEKLLLQQLTDSARAWVEVQKRVHVDAPVMLDPTTILSEDVEGRITITVDPHARGVLVIHAQISFSGRDVSRTSRFIMSSG